MRNFEQRKAEILKRSNERIKRRRIKISIISIACVFVIALAGIGAQQAIQYRNTDPVYKKILRFPVVQSNKDEFEITEDIAIIPPWDSLSITEQYSELDVGGVRYLGRKAEIYADMVLDKIGDYTAYGFDEIEWKNYTKSAEAYSIKGISSDCVVAVKLEGTNVYYAYINAHYKPETLGDFIDDVNLKELLSFGNISYNYSKIIEDTYINERIEFADVDDKLIWQNLLSDTTLKNVHSDETWYEKTVISIGVDIELLCYKNISLWITEDGYMHTNILDTGKTFYIGKEKVTELTNYLLDNCDGKRYVYTTVDESMTDSGEYEENVSYEVKSYNIKSEE